MRQASEAVIEALKTALGADDDDERVKGLRAGHDMRFDALDLDSLSRFEAIMQIEDRLGIELDDDEVQDQQSVFDLIRHVEGKLAEG
ncbi:MAG: acyl carrier protein [Geminicoccaceae bacterium]